MLWPRVVGVTALLCVSASCDKKKDEPTTTPPERVAAAAGEEEEEAEEAEEESPYLDVSNFNQKVEESVGEVVACYNETAGKEASPPTGRVRVTVVVDGDGRAKDVTFDAQRSDLKHEALYACIKGKVKGWRFNITLTGADSPMPYTFDLRSGQLLP
jgi:hypothetical protein